MPGWTRSWPRSREREVGWRGRGPSSLRGRQGRQQEDDHNVDHDDDDVDYYVEDHNVEDNCWTKALTEGVEVLPKIAYSTEQ